MPLADITSLPHLIVIDPRDLVIFAADDVRQHALKAFQVYSPEDWQDGLVPSWLTREQFQQEFVEDPNPIPKEMQGTVFKSKLKEWAVARAAVGYELEFFPTGKCYKWHVTSTNWAYGLSAGCEILPTTPHVFDSGPLGTTWLPMIYHDGWTVNWITGEPCEPIMDYADYAPGAVKYPASMQLHITGYSDGSGDPFDPCQSDEHPGVPMPVPTLPARVEIVEEIPVPPLIPCECVDGAPGPEGPQGPPGPPGGGDVQLDEFKLKHPRLNSTTGQYETIETVIHLPANESHDMGTAFGVLFEMLSQLMLAQVPDSSGTQTGKIVVTDINSSGVG